METLIAWLPKKPGVWHTSSLIGAWCNVRNKETNEWCFQCAGTFDVVVVNLYPFYAKVSSSSGISFEDGIENIDIGGPAMIRAAAKVA